MNDLLNLFQNMSALVSSNEYTKILIDKPASYDLNQKSLFLDIGSGFGKPVFHAAYHSGCESLGIEVVPARVEFCLDFYYESVEGGKLLDEFYYTTGYKEIKMMENQQSVNRSKKVNSKVSNCDWDVFNSGLFHIIYDVSRIKVNHNILEKMQLQMLNYNNIIDFHLNKQIIYEEVLDTIFDYESKKPGLLISKYKLQWENKKPDITLRKKDQLTPEREQTIINQLCKLFGIANPNSNLNELKVDDSTNINTPKKENKSIEKIEKIDKFKKVIKLSLSKAKITKKNQRLETPKKLKSSNKVEKIRTRSEDKWDIYYQNNNLQVRTKPNWNFYFQKDNLKKRTSEITTNRVNSCSNRGASTKNTPFKYYKTDITLNFKHFLNSLGDLDNMFVYDLFYFANILYNCFNINENNLLSFPKHVQIKEKKTLYKKFSVPKINNILKQYESKQIIKPSFITNNLLTNSITLKKLKERKDLEDEMKSLKSKRESKRLDLKTKDSKAHQIKFNKISKLITKIKLSENEIGPIETLPSTHNNHYINQPIPEYEVNLENLLSNNIDNINPVELLKRALNTKRYEYFPDWHTKVNFISQDATKNRNFSNDKHQHYTHIYSYNKLMSSDCRQSMAKVLNKTNYKILAWYSNPKQTEQCGLKGVKFICKFPMQSTSTEKFHCYVYIKIKGDDYEEVKEQKERKSEKAVKKESKVKKIRKVRRFREVKQVRLLRAKTLRKK